MAKYTEPQKLEMVRLFHALNREGCVDIKGKEVQNIRAFCKELNVSSQSIYRWAEKFAEEIENEEKEFLECSSSNWCKSYQPIDDFNLTCNCIPSDCFIKGSQVYPEDFEIESKRDDVIDENTYGFEVLKESEPMTFKMGTTFFQTLAQGLGIKKYRMPLNQLYLKIGNELMKMSGLVENGVREELRIE